MLLRVLIAFLILSAVIEEGMTDGTCHDHRKKIFCRNMKSRGSCDTDIAKNMCPRTCGWCD
ncbi:shTK domain protein [Oesophagostomum dentatum]|uniref:ShTK domain protein n=1 Tax=Oesophagostomum dentatum TaxID=61180 RepID=A0A0B1SX04_OESDE|nr:shTK domain protein [Oesophagostomum dentatum]